MYFVTLPIYCGKRQVVAVSSRSNGQDLSKFLLVNSKLRKTYVGSAGGGGRGQGVLQYPWWLGIMENKISATGVTATRPKHKKYLTL